MQIICHMQQKAAGQRRICRVTRASSIGEQRKVAPNDKNEVVLVSPMSNLKLVYDPTNLDRAWNWILSNPDAAYKGYFRTLYANYGVASTELLRDLGDRIRHGVYEPAASCKLFLPKPSGILRPFSLLTVEDQIVYQALVNVVAERLFPKVKHRYRREVFGHLYAGHGATWFYQKWQKSYAAYNNAARHAFVAGFNYTAKFDLTAFYDSLDHGVLCHFLEKLRLDRDFTRLLTNCLSHWTSAQGEIFHNHGIPQGPLSSGLLAEVVLQHFDRHHRAPKTVRYLRYVDDIRLLATSLPDLRRMVTWLDYLSKEVGLFPQSSKLEIRQITDIESELKSVSQPYEELYDEECGDLDQKLLRRRIKELSARNRVSDPTEFKFLLGRANPSSEINERLWKVLENHPEMYASVLRYFQRYKLLPTTSGQHLIAALRAKPRFGSVVAELMRTAEGRLQPYQDSQIDLFVKSCATQEMLPTADLLAAVGRRGMQRALLTSSQVAKRLRENSPWWTRAELLSVLDDAAVARPLRDILLNERLQDATSDVAIAAAVCLAVPVGSKLTVPHKQLQTGAARVLESFRMVPKGAGTVCGIERYFRKLLQGNPPAMDWKRFLGRDYRSAERQAVLCSGLALVNVTAWVNAMDVLDDWLLKALFRRDKTLGGTYTIGKLGAMMHQGNLKTNYPAVQALVVEIHEKRGESSLSHPVKKKGAVIIKRAGLIRYGYIFRAKTYVRKALAELSTAAATNKC